MPNETRQSDQPKRAVTYQSVRCDLTAWDEVAISWRAWALFHASILLAIASDCVALLLRPLSQKGKPHDQS